MRNSLTCLSVLQNRLRVLLVPDGHGSSAPEIPESDPSARERVLARHLHQRAAVDPHPHQPSVEQHPVARSRPALVAIHGAVVESVRCSSSRMHSVTRCRAKGSPATPRTTSRMRRRWRFQMRQTVTSWMPTSAATERLLCPSSSRTATSRSRDGQSLLASTISAICSKRPGSAARGLQREDVIALVAVGRDDTALIGPREAWRIDLDGLPGGRSEAEPCGVHLPLIARRPVRFVDDDGRRRRRSKESEWTACDKALHGSEPPPGSRATFNCRTRGPRQGVRPSRVGNGASGCGAGSETSGGEGPRRVRCR